MIQTLSTGSPCAFCGGTAEDSFRLDLRAEDEDAGLGACSTPSIGTGALLLLLPLDMPLGRTVWIVASGSKLRGLEPDGYKGPDVHKTGPEKHTNRLAAVPTKGDFI